MKFSWVPKPKAPRRPGLPGEYDEIYAALPKTAENGKALRIEPNGKSHDLIRNTIRRKMNKNGMSVHSILDEDGAVVIWLEEMDDRWLQRKMR